MSAETNKIFFFESFFIKLATLAIVVVLPDPCKPQNNIFVIPVFAMFKGSLFNPNILISSS